MRCIGWRSRARRLVTQHTMQGVTRRRTTHMGRSSRVDEAVTGTWLELCAARYMPTRAPHHIAPTLRRASPRHRRKPQREIFNPTPTANGVHPVTSYMSRGQEACLCSQPVSIILAANLLPWPLDGGSQLPPSNWNPWIQPTFLLLAMARSRYLFSSATYVILRCCPFSSASRQHTQEGGRGHGQRA